jgi:flagellar protein FliS
VQSSAQNTYFETEVMTATPQKRQLMLLEGAIRLIERTRQHWRADEDVQASDTLIRAQQIITELLSSLNHEVAPELTRKVAALYLFVFRRLIDANLHRDEQRLEEALSVLEPQREAWKGVCEELGSTLPSGDGAAASLSLRDPTPQTPPRPSLPLDTEGAAPPSTGLSLEA